MDGALLNRPNTQQAARPIRRSPTADSGNDPIKWTYVPGVAGTPPPQAGVSREMRCR